MWLDHWDDVGRTYEVIQSARERGAIPVLVSYFLPARDCGTGYSAGGAADASAYRDWVDELAMAIGGTPAVVVLEPDALPQLDCLDEAQRRTRLELLRDATRRLEEQPRTQVYLDAGHSDWIGAQEMAARLREAGVDHARGFALNVSNFNRTRDEVAYAHALAEAVGGSPAPHAVIDTSRNGNGPMPEAREPEGESWCNPPGRALGRAPTTETGDPLIDAYLWIKPPGDSDGTCRGGPPAGQWWLEYALELSFNAGG